jgi:stress response protein YsnF
VRLTTRRADDADLIRARLRVLLAEPVAAPGWLPDEDEDEEVDADLDDADRSADDADASGDDARGSGDDAMTRSEEEVTIKPQARPRERVRLKKYVVTEPVTKTVPVRREEIRVERVPVEEDDDAGTA